MKTPSNPRSGKPAAYCELLKLHNHWLAQLKFFLDQQQQKDDIISHILRTFIEKKDNPETLNRAIELHDKHRKHLEVLRFNLFGRERK